MEDAIISPISLAMLTGAGLKDFKKASKEDRIRVHTTFDCVIEEDGWVTIDKTLTGNQFDDIVYSPNRAQIYGTILDNAGSGVMPVFMADIAYAGNDVAGKYKDAQGNDLTPINRECIVGDPDNAHVFHVDDNTPMYIQFAGCEGYEGCTLRVDCYCEKISGAFQLSIDAKNFAGTYYVEASTLFREQSTGEDFPAEIVIPNAKIASNFTFNMSNSGDPSTSTHWGVAA